MPSQNRNFYVSSFYHFFKLNNLSEAQASLKELAESHQALGLIILGPEGLNATVATPHAESLSEFKDEIQKYFSIEIKNFKDSFAEIAPFRRFSVKLRDEIVTAGLPNKSPDPGKNHHLSPSEWDALLQEENDLVIIDTRNWYEYQLGSFKGALNPNIEKFTAFPQYFEKQQIPKDKKILIFCTGGIRCEKGILELQEKGYENVYQLDGGILNYLKEKPNQNFEGECFVFDNRVALDQELKASAKYKLCPHCGQPAHEILICQRCGTETRVCEACLLLDWKKETCSKNCAYHYPRELKSGRVMKK